MIDPVRDALAWLAGFGLTGAVAAAAAYWLFKLFGKGWIDSHFQKDLEAYRALKGVELERLRADIVRLTDRATKFHEREYEVLPKAWGLLNQAHSAVGECVMALQQYPDLDRMSDAKLEEFLATAELTESDKSEIRDSGDRGRTYSKIYTWVQIRVAVRAQAELQNYIILQGIFVEDGLCEKFERSNEFLRSAVIARRIGEQHGPNHQMWDAAIKEFQNAAPLVAEIRADVKQRLSDIRLREPIEAAP